MTRHRVPMPTGPRRLQVLASVVRRHTADPLSYYRELVDRYGDIVFFRIGTKTFCLLNTAEGIEHVLKDNHENYTKGPSYESFRAFIGDGLLTSEGEAWRRQRKLMQPPFHHEAISAFASAVVELADEMIDRWRPAAEAAQPLDITAEMTRIALAVVGRTLLGGDSSHRSEDVRVAAAAIQQKTAEQLHSWLRLVDLILPTRSHISFALERRLPTGSNRRFRAAVRTLDDIVYQLIAGRRRSGVVTKDLLAMLMASRDDESTDGMSDIQLRDEVMTMFLAGHETTATALGWAFYLLDRHPDVQGRLRHEIAAHVGDGPTTYADLARLPYLACVVDEVLRLYPPFWRLSRHARGDDDIAGCRIPAGCVVLLSPWLTHRHPAYWTDPERFDPDRFRPECRAGRPRFAYFPFGGGPRICIGNSFALMEIRLILARVLRSYRVSLVSKAHVEPEPRITLRPRGELLVTLEPVAT